MPKQRFTPEELDVLEQQTSPQKKRFSPEELDAMAGVSLSEGPSGLEAAARGAAQGATFGLSDEATAALESLLSKAGSAIAQQQGITIPETTYEQALKESREAYKAAEEAHPGLYGGSEIAGGIASAFIPGIGAIGTAGKAATLGGKVAAGAAAGALAGGLTGLGKSEASLVEQPTELAADVLMSSLLGGGLGATLPVAGFAAGKVGKVGSKVGEKLKEAADEFIEESPLLKIGKEIYKESKAGAELTKAERTNLQNQVKQSVDYLQELVKNKATSIDDVVQVVDDLKSTSPKFKAGDLLKEVEKKSKNPDLSPDEKTDLRNLYNVLKQATGIKTEEKLVAAGPVKLGAATKAEQKINKALAEERLKVEKDLLETQVQIGKADQYDDPSLFQTLSKKYTDLKNRLTEIDQQASQLKTELGEEGKVGMLQPSKPIRDSETGDVVGLTKAKIKAEAVPEQQIGDYTPIKAEEVQTITKPELSAVESRQLQAELNKLGVPESSLGKELKAKAMEQTKAGMARGDETLTEAVDIANKEFSKVKDILEEKGLGLKETQLSQNVEYKKAMGDVRDNYQKLLEMSRKAGASDIVETETNKIAKDRLQQSLNNLKDIDPEIGQAMEDQLMQAGKRYALAEEISKPRLLGSKDITGLAGGAIGIAYKGARTAGKVAKYLAELPESEMGKIVESVSGNTKTLLQKIAASPDRASRQAYIFAAMQRPEFRKELGINEEEK